MASSDWWIKPHVFKTWGSFITTADSRGGYYSQLSDGASDEIVEYGLTIITTLLQHQKS
ncbi:MAG TPA: hypothetical protein VE223_03685 [Nitrososphaeraceae archaeon]|nr:hypothetical protein [Nitrososphaeraceae archaeon]